jgi:hypothetical protein
LRRTNRVDVYAVLVDGQPWKHAGQLVRYKSPHLPRPVKHGGGQDLMRGSLGT